MAYTNFIPFFIAQESQDAMQLKIWDASTWDGQSGFTTVCDMEMSYFDDDGNLVEFDTYPLISGGDASKYNEYLDRDGHIINLKDLTIGGLPVGFERFPEGYYNISLFYSDGSYAEGSFPHYDNPTAFLAKYRFMARRLPIDLLTFPLTEEVYLKNREIFLLRMYLQNCEDAADYGKHIEFMKYLAIIRQMFDHYTTQEPW